ncbi:MAG: hypothetical protein B7Y45_09455 [Sphingomonas sp. 28-66-16]|nr:MAG: hypothetical protein B7Y45_09455 [Sphingomonas sp. 28-66-16]
MRAGRWRAPAMRGAVTVLAVVAAGLVTAGLAAADLPVIGINAAIVNNVRLRHAGDAAARTATLRQRVLLNDEVQTGGNSQLQVMLLDRSMFNVGANARLTIDRFVYDPARGTRSLGASVARGAFRFVSGQPDARGTAAIRTPIAAIGIRGTMLEGVVGAEAVLIASGEAAIGPAVQSDPATASLIILRGPGARAPRGTAPGLIDVTAAGRRVTLDRPLAAAYVPRPGAPPIGPFRISAEGLRLVQALLFPALAQELGLPVPGASDSGFTPFTPGTPEPRRPLDPRAFPPGAPNGGFERGSGPQVDPRVPGGFGQRDPAVNQRPQATAPAQPTAGTTQSPPSTRPTGTAPPQPANQPANQPTNQAAPARPTPNRPPPGQGPPPPP